MKKIYFITGNKGKFLEAKKKFSAINVEIVQKNLGYPEIQVDNLEDVAIFGVKHIQKKFNKAFILEDAGLFIDALNGFPGVYSSYVFHTIGCEGLLKLLKEYNNEKRRACFRSVIAYHEPEGKNLFFTGECHGEISTKMLGDHGFGYDPIFIPDGAKQTFAQMKIEEKNKFSHRSKSIDKMIEVYET